MNKKRFLIPLLVLLCLVTVLAVCLPVYILKPTQLTIDVEPVSGVNYNNYIYDNQMDYKGNQLAWQSNILLGTKVTLHSGDSKPSVLFGKMSSFQLLENRIVYIKNNDLWASDLNGKNKNRIAQNVSSFVATEEKTFYLAEDVLLQYGWDTGEIKTLGEDVHRFYWHQEKLYIVDLNGQLMCLEADGSWNKRYTFTEMSYPFFVMPQGGTVVYLENNELKWVDLSTGNVESVRLSDDNYANNYISYICDDSHLYVSFQATKTDGSVVTEADHANNGVWYVGAQSKNKEKVCDETFQRLYLFDGNLLFGVKDGQLYQIDAENGNVTKISG